jgi:serine O-acetyltransferase
MNAITLYRLGHWCHSRRLPLLPKLVRNLTFLLFNSYIPPSARLGTGTVFAYGAIGLVLHGDTVIGRDCVIGQGITVGAAEGYFSKGAKKCPRIGNNCYIGAGARLLGGIEIGDNCIIAAGAVVLKSVPSCSVVAGVPARVIGRTEAGYQAIER